MNDLPLEFLLSIFINLIAIGVIFGTYKTTIEFMQGQISEIKKQSEKDKEELKEEMRKYNNMLERMIRVEDSTKSAHHRIDTLEEKEIKR